MPAQLKEVRNRIKSVQNTQQITKAMKMVSAAKLRRAQDAIQQMRPYANQLQKILGNISEGESEIVFTEEREVKNVLLVLVTSDKGLCGSYNSNLIKVTRQAIEEKYAEYAEKGHLRLLTIGKKGFDYFSKTKMNIISDFTGMLNELNFNSASGAANYIMENFVAGEFDRVEVIYSKFKNAATQEFMLEQYLPVVKLDEDKTAPDQEEKIRPDYIFEPSQQEILKELVPKILRTQIFKYVLDANASEHGARMTAMDQATENANELLRDLRISYNRARQAAITTELTEIVSGANALG